MKRFSILSIIIICILMVGVLFACTPKDVDYSDDDTNTGNDDSGIVLSFDTVYAYAKDAGYKGTMEELVEMFKGDSAYEIAVANGYEGTEVEWLATLIGATGKDGTNGTDGKDGAGGVDGIDGITPHIGENGNWHIGDIDTGIKAQGPQGSQGEQGIQGPQGEKGETGATGNGIAQILKKTDGLINVYTLTYTNGQTYDIVITNGANGNNGTNGITPSIGENGNWYLGDVDTGVLASGKNGVGISGITKTTDGLVDSYVIDYSNGDKYSFTINNGKDGVDGITPEIGENGNWWIGTTDTGVKAQGDKGETGNGIASINKESNGSVDTYTITYTDGTTYELIITNGLNGTTPHIGTNGNWWIGDSDTTVPAQGDKGETGNGINYITKTSNGLTDTYTIHFTNGESYSFDVTNAPSTLMVKVTFDAEGGVINDSYTYLDLALVNGTTDVYECDFNAYNSIKELPIPTKENLVFAGWYTGTTINDTQWFNNSTISGDITLYARWTDNKYSLEVVSNDYTLGIPEYVSGEYQANQTILLVAQPLDDNAFVGWYDQDDKLLSTRYTYSITKQPKSEKIVAKFTDKYPLFELDTKNTYHVVGYVGAPTEIIIPAEYNGASVHYIDESAFEGCISLNNIVIPNSILNIGEKAFYNCSALIAIDIPDNVDYIGAETFNGCGSLESITIPFTGSSRTGIDESALFGYIFGSTFYNGSMKISQYTNTYVGFYVPEKLKTVKITGNIASSAFRGCENIENISIGANVISIGKNAFFDCKNLKNVENDSIESWCGITFGDATANPIFYAKKLYINGELVTDLVIPNTVTKINDYAFSGCSSLTSVVIPDSVMSIGEDAFKYCYKLVEVYNLSALTITAGSSNNGYVGGYAKNIYTSLDTPSKLSTDSNGYVIYTDGTDKILVGYTGSETELVLPDGITEINNYAFYKCSSLTSVYYNGDATMWNSISIGSNNSNLTNATRYYYSETEPTESGNYWHYVDGIVTVW